MQNMRNMQNMQNMKNMQNMPNVKIFKFAKNADWLKQSTSGSAVPLAIFIENCGSSNLAHVFIFTFV